MKKPKSTSNANFSQSIVFDSETKSMLVEMAAADDRSESYVVRSAVRNEWQRRQGVTTSEFHGPETLEEDVERRR
ncbi:MAG TPA: hypothetical protein PKD23_06855 [Bellilinea sp.]|nr:hypothetical protein [Bellilinea sp.]